LGTPLEPLPANGRQAALEFAMPPTATAFPGLPVYFEVMVTNRSAVPWPALVSVGQHMVNLGYRWEDEQGHLKSEVAAAARLPYDLAPGESVRATVLVLAPALGPHRLKIGVTQDGAWLPDNLAPIPINVLPIEALVRMRAPPTAKQ
jgi:hypothetical protein